MWRIVANSVVIDEILAFRVETIKIASSFLGSNSIENKCQNSIKTVLSVVTSSRLSHPNYIIHFASFEFWSYTTLWRQFLFSIRSCLELHLKWFWHCSVGFSIGHFTRRSWRWKCHAGSQPAGAGRFIGCCQSDKSRQRNDHRLRRRHLETGNASLIEPRRRCIALTGRRLSYAALRPIFRPSSQEVDWRFAWYLARYFLSAALLRWIRSAENHPRMQACVGLPCCVWGHRYDGRLGAILEGSQSVLEQSVARSKRPWKRVDPSSS